MYYLRNQQSICTYVSFSYAIKVEFLYSVSSDELVCIVAVVTMRPSHPPP